MKATKELERIINWAGSTSTSVTRRGMLVEIRDGKILVINREHTIALLTNGGEVGENLRFYSDEYPLGKYPDIKSDGNNTIFSWVEDNQKRTVSYPATEKSFFNEMIETFNVMEKEKENPKNCKTIDFTKLLDDMKFTELNLIENTLTLIQTDPRGIISETEITGEKGIRSIIGVW